MSKKAKPSLFSATVLLVSFILAIAVLGASYYWTEKRALLMQAQQLSDRVGNVVAFLGSRAELLGQTPSVLANDQLLQEALSTTTMKMDLRSALNNHLESVNKDVKALQIFVLEPSGTAIASSNWYLIYSRCIKLMKHSKHSAWLLTITSKTT